MHMPTDRTLITNSTFLGQVLYMLFLKGSNYSYIYISIVHLFIQKHLITFYKPQLLSLLHMSSCLHITALPLACVPSDKKERVTLGPKGGRGPELHGRCLTAGMGRKSSVKNLPKPSIFGVLHPKKWNQSWN